MHIPLEHVQYVRIKLYIICTLYMIDVHIIIIVLYNRNNNAFCLPYLYPIAMAMVGYILHIYMADLLISSGIYSPSEK